MKVNAISFFIHSRCHKCDVIENDEASMKLHVRKFHRKSHTCPLCDKVLSCLQKLKGHMQNIHRNKEKSEKTFICEHCNKG